MSSEPELSLDPPYASMADFYGDVERNLVLVLDAYSAEGIAPTCRKGCDACCHQLAMTTMAEARAAALHLVGLPEPEAARLRSNIVSWQEATGDLRSRLQAGANEDLEELVEELAAKYWERRVPCPFLSDGSCAIYEARPLICRHHFSVTDPAFCQTGEEGAIERMEAMDEAFFISQSVIPEDEAEIGFFPELVALVLDE